MTKLSDEENTLIALYKALEEATELNKVLLKSFSELVTEYTAYKTKTEKIMKIHLESLNQITHKNE